MCRLTEQVIFMDPYHAAPVNSHTTPHLDELVHSLRSDTQAKLAASALKVSNILHCLLVVISVWGVGSVLTQQTSWLDSMGGGVDWLPNCTEP